MPPLCRQSASVEGEGMTPRRKLRPYERAQLFERQNGLCSCGCGQPLTGNPMLDQDEHTNCRWVSGDDQLSNRTLMLRDCHKAKTARDKKAIAKIKRLIAKAAGTTKPKRKINGRGFDKSLKRKLDGTVEKRA